CIEFQSASLPDRAQAKTKKELADDDRLIEDASRRHRAELRALVPPPRLRELARRWLDALDATTRAYDTYLDASAGPAPRARASALDEAERLTRQSNRLAARLAATGCTLAALGEGYRPYSLGRVESALIANHLRYTDPLRTSGTFATGWSACDAIG